jgi:hypothetical protein
MDVPRTLSVRLRALVAVEEEKNNEAFSSHDVVVLLLSLLLHDEGFRAVSGTGEADAGHLRTVCGGVYPALRFVRGGEAKDDGPGSPPPPPLLSLVVRAASLGDSLRLSVVEEVDEEAWGPSSPAPRSAHLTLLPPSLPPPHPTSAAVDAPLLLDTLGTRLQLRLLLPFRDPIDVAGRVLPHLLHLPEGLFARHLLPFLSPADLCALDATCAALQPLANDESAWAAILRRADEDPRDYREKILRGAGSAARAAALAARCRGGELLYPEWPRLASDEQWKGMLALPPYGIVPTLLRHRGHGILPEAGPAREAEEGGEGRRVRGGGAGAHGRRPYPCPSRQVYVRRNVGEAQALADSVWREELERRTEYWPDAEPVRSSFPRPPAPFPPAFAGGHFGVAPPWATAPDFGGPGGGPFGGGGLGWGPSALLPGLAPRPADLVPDEAVGRGGGGGGGRGRGFIAEPAWR